MAGSVYGKYFQVSTWGESHGAGIGAVVDGCPAGLPLTEEVVQRYLDRRKPGQTRYSTPRKEEDRVEILSGTFQGRTTGTPISLVVHNTSQRSGDYSQIAGCYRPGHADYTFDAKYGFRDYRGGGRSSGRETIGRVAAGAIASEALRELGVEVCAYAEEIGGIRCRRERMSEESLRESSLYMPDLEASREAELLLEKKMGEQDSVGGIITCVARGVPAGVGEPVFDKLDASLARAVMSIGAVKGVEIGDGFAVAGHFGSENNDAFVKTPAGVAKETNHAGGILGGISDGSEIVLRAAVKPTPSIGRVQRTVNTDGEETEIAIRGRHDPIIVPRAVVVVESMVALTLLDMMLESMHANLDRIKRFFGR